MTIMNAAAYMPADIWADALRSVNMSLSLRAMKGEKVTNKKASSNIADRFAHSISESEDTASY